MVFMRHLIAIHMHTDCYIALFQMTFVAGPVDSDSLVKRPNYTCSHCHQYLPHQIAVT